jgi:hypothetical protein
MEISSISMRQHDECRIGYLVSDAMEPYGTDEWWEENKDEYDSQRPTERAYRIKRLIGGEEFRWTNAKMVRVVTNAIGELP